MYVAECQAQSLWDYTQVREHMQCKVPATATVWYTLKVHVHACTAHRVCVIWNFQVWKWDQLVCIFDTSPFQPHFSLISGACWRLAGGIKPHLLIYDNIQLRVAVMYHCVITTEVGVCMYWTMREREQWGQSTISHDWHDLWLASDQASTLVLIEHNNNNKQSLRVICTSDRKILVLPFFETSMQVYTGYTCSLLV